MFGHMTFRTPLYLAGALLETPYLLKLCTELTKTEMRGGMGWQWPPQTRNWGWRNRVSPPQKFRHKGPNMHFYSAKGTAERIFVDFVTPTFLTMSVSGIDPYFRMFIAILLIMV